MLADQGEDLGGDGRDVGAGAVDRADPGLLQEIVILRRDDAAADDQNVAGAFLLQAEPGMLEGSRAACRMA